ncbi:MAG: DNA primase [Prevotellaceae bacterium]|jgi:DNA primase catalytic core|nr:DNA primase [Prevotellaceae bacterium]
MISQEIIDKILANINIVDLISEYVNLHKKGSNYTGCCPFHDEKTPSFFVSPSKGIYKCFGCGVSGNAIKFIQEHEQLSFSQAIKFLASKTRIIIEDDYTPTAEEKAKYEHRESLKVVTRWAENYFCKNTKQKECQTYLRTRKFKKETIEKFKIGFASGDWHSLQQSAESAGFKKQFLTDASLIGEGERGTYDYFRSRIIFPICDITGSVVGFTGRTVNNDEKTKYLNSKDSDLFKKGSCLYGLHLAKKSIVKADECILLEGNFDVMRFHELGFENSIASCGTALTKSQIAMIRRFTLNMLLCYDGDSAGEKATFRNAELLLQEGMNVRMVALPTGHDPDSYGLSTNSENIKQLLATKKDFVSFKYEIIRQSNDPLQIAAAVKELERLIALIPDKGNREIYINKVSDNFNLNKKTVRDSVKKNIKKPVEVKTEGWTGLEAAKEAIQKNNKCFIADDMETLVSYHAEGNENTVMRSDCVLYSHVQELNNITQRVEFVNDKNYLLDNIGTETSFAILCGWMLDFNFSIIIRDKEYGEPVNYIVAYADECRKLIQDNSNDEIIMKRLIEQCCKILSKLDDALQTVYLKKYADSLLISVADLKKILKPHITAKKNKNTLKHETSNLGGKQYNFDINKLPDYVDKDFFYQHQYFPAQDENGKKIFYVFRTAEGGLQVVGNFYIEPLFHVFDTEDAKNKRIVRINNSESGITYYAEFLSEKLIEFGQFKKVLFSLGGNVFVRGKAEHHEKIIASIANQFPTCYELNEFGQQYEDFYAFANAIFSEGQIKYTDELGLVAHKDKIYYSPSFSKIYSELRKSNNKYENDKWFVFRENDETDFATWANLMTEVYKQNMNGQWALLFALLSVFRSDIYPINRLFTAPFFIGPTESGKTQIAISIRSLFMHPDAPTFNLNSGTDAAFFSSMERYRDVSMIFEEYNDYQISDIKFQGLKAAVYDGEGKQKKKDATSKDLDISKINCAVILLGQEAPERDDGSLANRCILLHVPKKDDWTDSERQLLLNLKQREKKGLSGVLLQILRKRNIIKEHFTHVLDEVYKELKKDLNEKGDIHNSRLINTVSLFLSICKIFEQYIPELQLPFKYKQFYNIARNKVITQSESISNTNRLSVFFETLDVLLNNNEIIQGREYKIEWEHKLTLQIDRQKTVEHVLAKDTRVLYLRIGLIHTKYMKIRGSESLKMNNLLMYLKDHPAYIGQVKSTRFTWKEYTDMKDEFSGMVRRTEKINNQNTTAVVLDYFILKELININLEKVDDVENYFPPVAAENNEKTENIF